MTCLFLFLKRAQFCACVFCKAYVFARLLKLLTIAFNFKVMINDKVIKHNIYIYVISGICSITLSLIITLKLNAAIARSFSRRAK